jgi:cytoskeletal protein CcmA (bactofilin family)
MINKNESISIIDENTKIDGIVSIKGKIIINGFFSGVLTAKTIMIAPKSNVNGEIKASDITVAGNFEGSLTAFNKLSILSNGVCYGKLICNKIFIEHGANLDAEIKCGIFERPPNE